MTILTKSKKHKIFEEIAIMQKAILKVDDSELFMKMQNSLVNIAGELYNISELKKVEKQLKEQTNE